MTQVIYLALATASISFTITETRLFQPLREWIKKRSPFWGEWISCGYCFGHWVAFGLVALYRPRLFYGPPVLDYCLTALVVAWLAGIQWAAVCLLLDKTHK